MTIIDTEKTEQSQKKTVTRFAPSPTGFVHVGGIRTALYAYLYAKKNNGDFILRIEDTDRERSVDGAVTQIMQSLRWILSGDESLESVDPWAYGPNKPSPIFGSCIQSERLATYTEYAQKLFDAGLAYSDPYTKEELDILRGQAEVSKRAFLYRDHRPEVLNTAWDKAKPLRLKINDIGRTDWRDAVRGDLSAGAEALDDFILIKADGFPTYNFCHIIDDIEMEVTHIMRGEEFIASTPKFLALYKALQSVFPEKNIELPIFVTLPPILGETGTKKLSKRDGAKDVLDYHKEGFLPEALVNFLAFQGWNPGGEKEIYSSEDLIQTFTLERIQKSGARWNIDKLNWYNKEYIKLLTDAELEKILMKYMPEELIASKLFTSDKLQKISRLLADHINTFGDIAELYSKGEIQYFFFAPKITADILLWKNEPGIEITKARLQKVLDLFSNEKEDTFKKIDAIKSAISELTDKDGRGEILWPLRTALSGLVKSTDPFTIMYVIGKTETESRITNAIKTLN